MTSISLDEAARRLHKSREETLFLGRNGAFAGCFEDGCFKTVDPLSLDAYIQNNRHPAQRPLIPSHTEEIAARTAWSGREEMALWFGVDTEKALKLYRLEFPHSQRTDLAIQKHYRKMRAAGKMTPKKRPWYAAILDVIWPNRAGV